MKKEHGSGEWIQREDNVFECSNCGYCFEDEGYIAFFNFCPSCGTKMDKDVIDGYAKKIAERFVNEYRRGINPDYLINNLEPGIAYRVGQFTAEIFMAEKEAKSDDKTR